MGEIAETAAKFVEPLGKLIDSVSGAIGKAYEPRHIRKMADAEAYKIKKIGEALRENSDIPIEYNPEGVSLSTADFEQFVKRTQSRMAFQELKKQENIESVADKAYDLLEGEEPVTAEPVEEDWMLRFFNCVEDISNEKMQEIWAHILAGEIKKPNSFSLRTLDTLRNISSDEASLFEKVVKSGIVFNCIPHYNDFLKKHNISYADIMQLGECGLVNDAGLLTYTKTITDQMIALVHNHDRALLYRNLLYPEKNELTIEVFPLTTTGKQIASLFFEPLTNSQMEEIGALLRTEAKNATLHIHPLILTANNDLRINTEMDFMPQEEK